MRKLIPLAICLSMILTLIPVLNVSIISSSPLTIIDNVGPDASSRSIVAYRAIGDYYVYSYQGGASPYKFYLIVVHKSGTIQYNGYPALNYNGYFYDVSLDGNATGILLAYRHRRNDAVNHDDLNIAYIRYDGTKVTELVLAEATGHQRAPVVKFGGGYWFVGYYDDNTPGTFRIVLYNDKLTSIHSTSVTIGRSKTVGGATRYSGVDFRERAFYSPLTNKFYTVALDVSGPIDLVLIEYDPVSRSATKRQITTDGDSAVECNPDFSKEYRMCYAQLLGDNKHLLVVYTYVYTTSGIYPVRASIIDLEAGTVKTTITLQEMGTSRNIYPWVSASSTEWLISWYDGTNSNLAFITPGGEYKITRIVPPQGYTTPGYITHVFNGEDYAVFYAVRKDSNDDLYSMRIDPILRRSLNPLVISNTTTHSENTNYPLIIEDKIVNLFWKIGSPNIASVAYLSYNEIPPSEAIPTEIASVDVTFDAGGDRYLEAGDSIVIKGLLRELLENTALPDKSITVRLINRIYYDSRGFTEVRTTVYEGTTRTGADGTFEHIIKVPDSVISGLYYLELSFPGEDPYSASSWTSPPSMNFIIVKTKPLPVKWVVPPTDISTGPGLLYRDGQVIITDPVDEVSTEFRVYDPITRFTGMESDDVDIRLLQLAIDENYLYVKAEFAGNATLDGLIIPALVLAFDFTPASSIDGALAGSARNMLLIYNMGYSDTHLKGARGWDLTIVMTVKDNRGRIFVDPVSSSYALHIAPAYRSGGVWYYREMSAGYLVANDNTLTAYIPIDALLAYATNFKASGEISWILFAAVFPINTTSGTIVSGIPFANWVDVPGVVTVNSTPSSFIEIGIRESATDDRLDTDTLRSWELDTFFKLNLRFPPVEAETSLLYVVDGDTIKVKITRVHEKFANRVNVGTEYYVRFADINAPELGTPEGDAAKNALSNLLSDTATIYLDIDDKYLFDAHGRIVAVAFKRMDDCRLLNINKWLLDNGYAVIMNVDNEFDPATWTLHLTRFFGRARLWVEETIIPITDYPTMSFDDRVAGYVGTAYYVVRAFDNDNRAYGIPGLTIEMLINGTPVAYGVTGYDSVYNNVGNATIGFKWLPEHRGKNHTVVFRTIATPDYASATTINFYVKPIYLGKIDYLTAYVVDADGRPTVGMGDKIVVNIGLSVWGTNWEPAPVGTKVRVYLNSTWFFLGYATVSEPGLAVLEYEVNGSEGLYDFNLVEHKIIVLGYPGEIWLMEIRSTSFPYSLSMIPAPEPATLSVALLALLALAIFIIRRRK